MQTLTDLIGRAYPPTLMLMLGNASDGKVAPSPREHDGRMRHSLGNKGYDPTGCGARSA